MEIIPIFIGMLFIAIGAYLTYDTYNFRKIAVRSQGKLLGYESHISKSSKGHRSTMYTPVIEFRCKGESYCFKATISRGDMPQKIGESVPVLYLENNPHDARMFTNLRYWLGGIFAVMGLIAFVIGVASFRFDTFSLLIAFAILVSFIYKIIQLKSKFNKKGVHSFDDFKKNMQQKVSGDDSILDSESNKNYQPSNEFITSQTEVSQRQKVPAWLGKVFLLIGVGLIIGGGIFAKQRAEFISTAVKTTGKVVDMRASTSDGSTTYAPLVRYNFNNEANPVTFKHKVSSTHPSWRRGDTVQVLYNPKDKTDAMIDDGLWNWMGPGVLAFIGIIFSLVGLTSSRKKDKTTSRARNKYVQ